MLKSVIILFFLLLISSINGIANTKNVKGVVFNDLNNNGKPDNNESGIEGIYISNGKDLVKTNKNGEWSINIIENSPVFLIKPPGYKVPLNKDMIPQHYHLFEPGDKSLQTIYFPLIPSTEKNTFKAIFFGDTQARGLKEVDYIFHDAVEELIGTDALFGVSLGDNVADDPELLDDISRGIAQIGIPWYNTFGNHDSDRKAKLNRDRDNTFEKYFGPSTYAFEYGNVAFIALNNIYFEESGRYRPHFNLNQLNFLKSYLQYIPDDKLIVLYMHAPVTACDNREELFELVKDKPHCFSISGHLHEQMNLFLTKDQDWNGKTSHHHLINATVSGSWWCGGKDELGIPHATMNDGAPNGYSIVSFNGNTYSVQFKAARRPENYQMNIYLPNEIQTDALDTTKVLVNVFAGSEKSKVEMQMNDEGRWIILKKVNAIDPECLRMHQLSPYLKKTVNEMPLDEVFGYMMDYPSISYHMWEGKLPGDLHTGTHKITIRTTDMYNKTWIAHRIFRIEDR